jgi:hypothetical protein
MNIVACRIASLSPHRGLSLPDRVSYAPPASAYRGVLLLLCAAFVMVGCVPVSTLTPAIRKSADDYGEIMADFSDKALLTNILRARDNAPMNFNDLSSITGSFSLSDTLALTIPFGPLTGSPTTSNSYKNSANPSVTGTASPVITLGTLNTQGFMMTMIQPVSTTYVLSKWNSHAHDVLLYLFVKSIRFPQERSIRNDPDDPTAFAAFRTLVSGLVDANNGNVDLKSLMVLDPLGDAVPFGRTFQSITPLPSAGPSSGAAPPAPHLIDQPSGSLESRTYYVRLTYVTSSGESPPSGESQFPVGRNHVLSVIAPPPPKGAAAGTILGYNIYVGSDSGTETKQNDQPHDIRYAWTEGNSGLILGTALPAAPGTQFQVSSDYQVIQTVTGLTDGQLHVGNAACPQVTESGPHALDLCPAGVKAPFVRFYKEYPAQIVMCVKTDDQNKFGTHLISPQSEAERNAAAGAGDLSSARQHSDAQRMMAAAPSKTPGGGSNTGGNTPSGAGSGAGGGGGGGGGGGTGGSGTGGAMPAVTLALQPNRISAMLHLETCEKDQLVLPTGTEEDFDDDSRSFTHVEWRSIAEVIQYLGALARYQQDNAAPLLSTLGRGANETLFAYVDGPAGRVSVHYRGDDFSIPNRTPLDHSLEDLALLNELVSIAKISGGLPVPQPVTVLP